MFDLMTALGLKVVRACYSVCGTGEPHAVKERNRLSAEQARADVSRDAGWKLDYTQWKARQKRHGRFLSLTRKEKSVSLAGEYEIAHGIYTQKRLAVDNSIRSSIVSADSELREVSNAHVF